MRRWAICLVWLASELACTSATQPAASPTRDAPEAAPKADATLPSRDAEPDTPPAPPRTGSLAVRVHASLPVRLTLTGPEEARIETVAPYVSCDARPGRWHVEARAKGHRSAEATIEVRADEVALAELALRPVGALSLVADGAIDRARLYAPDGSERVVELPWRDETLEPGLYAFRAEPADPANKPRSRPRVRVGGGRLSVAAVPAPGRSDSAIFAGRDRYALPPGIRVETWHARGEPSFHRGRGRRYVFRRRYDRGPVETLEQLQWAVRAIVITANAAEDSAAAVAERVARREARHFLVERDGLVRQTADLNYAVRGVGRLIDPSLVVIGLNGLMRSDAAPLPPTEAQLVSLRGLLRTLTGLLPRVQPRAPSDDAGRVLGGALADPRAFKGIMAHYHTGKQRLDPGPGLDWPRLLVEVDGVPREWRRSDPSDRSWLVVDSAPRQGARVELRGPPGHSHRRAPPVVVCDPRPGTWRVRADAADRASQSLELELAPGKPLWRTIELPRLGRLELAGPSGMQVGIEGPRPQVVQLPYKGNGLPVGTYRLSVNRDALPPWRWAVRVRAGETARVEVPALGDPKLGRILIDGVGYELPPQVRVVNYQDEGGLSFYREQQRIGRRDELYGLRRMPSGEPVEGLAEIAQQARLVVLHADVVPDTAAMFSVLVGRGLSSHFGIDWDGTIYQLLDPKHAAFAASEANPYAVQIDLNNLLPNLVHEPRARPYPPRHPRRREMRRPAFARAKSPRMTINGDDVRSYGFTAPQYRALDALLSVLCGVLDRIEPRAPRDAAGKVLVDWFDDAETFPGIVGHWHLTPRKWDPGPGFDWDRMADGLSGRDVAPKNQ